jgi:SAM-dependent methyltransferase
MTQPDFSPSADRNKQCILDVLQTFLPAQGTALEIASGTGQHVAWFATQLPQWTWQPTDAQRGALYSIEARAAQADLANVLEPLLLDVRTSPWVPEATHFDLIYCANMLHVAPWEACLALMQGSARHLAPGGLLVTYGPYFESDVTAAPSNVAFDQSLRQHDASWGIRQLDAVVQAAQAAGLQLNARHTMPANNLLLCFSRPAH